MSTSKGSEGAGESGSTYKRQCRQEIPGIAVPNFHLPKCPFCDTPTSGACSTCGEPSCTDTNVHTASSPESKRRAGGETDASTKEIGSAYATMESNPPLVPDIPKKTQILPQEPEIPTIRVPSEESLLPAQIDLTRKSMHKVTKAGNDGKKKDQPVTERTKVQDQKDKITDSDDNGKMSNSDKNEEQSSGASYSDGDKYYDMNSTLAPKGDNEGVNVSPQNYNIIFKIFFTIIIGVVTQAS